jgi:hypothetical protein
VELEHLQKLYGFGENEYFVLAILLLPLLQQSLCRLRIDIKIGFERYNRHSGPVLTASFPQYSGFIIATPYLGMLPFGKAISASARLRTVCSGVSFGPMVISSVTTIEEFDWSFSHLAESDQDGSRV